MKKVIRLFSVLLVLALLGMVTNAEVNNASRAYASGIVTLEDDTVGSAYAYISGDGDFGVEYNATATTGADFYPTVELRITYATDTHGMVVPHTVLYKTNSAGSNSTARIVWLDSVYPNDEGTSGDGDYSYIFSGLYDDGHVYYEYDFDMTATESDQPEETADYGYAFFSGYFYIDTNGNFVFYD